MSEQQEPGYEEAFASLESIVARLEEGTGTLDEALGLYEEGSRLADHCARLLAGAELRVNQLREQADGDLVEQPWES